MTAPPDTQQTTTATPAAVAGSGAGRLSEAALARLVARVRAGDREALGELYRHTRPTVTRYLTKRMDVCRDDVEDVVQETYLRAPEMADTFEPATTPVAAWLCGRVARWTMADHFRKQRFAQHSAKDAAIDVARRAPFEPTWARESRPLSARVVTALARLTPAERRAVQLRYLDGYSNETAAQEAGTSPAALVQSALTARRRLAKELADLAQQPVSSLATAPKRVAMGTALAETGGDVPAARAWLAERGVAVDESYAYQIRKGTHRPRENVKDAAVREALAELGTCDAATVQARLAERGIEVSKGYVNTVRREVGAPVPTNKNLVVREALAELGTTDARVVQAHLAERGIEVSRSYINEVRRSPAPAASASSADEAAERADEGLAALTKGEAVRVALAELGEVTAPTVSAWLAERGVRVHDAYVRQVRSGRRCARASASTGQEDPTGQPGQPEPARAEPVAALSAGVAPVDTSASNPGPGVRGVGGERADRAASAIERARQAVARIPAARAATEDTTGRKPTRLDTWRDQAETARQDRTEQLEVSA